MLEREIFDSALDIDDPTERSRFIDQQCGNDSDLRKHLYGLLEVHQSLGDFLDSPPTLVEAITDSETMIAGGGPQPTIENYQLIKRIGQGGMGIVYLAEQIRPVRRQVAVKVIKPGMDSQEVVARFEAERQTLAMMDHPNIAQVFDGGTTDQGYPYFAMELVQGLPITDYCLQQQYDTDERLALFRKACRGVQHAHQKGIIHRDIKPSNIIVIEHDGVATVKVIDFGIAKAIQCEPTTAPFVTAHGQWIGTPAYMSPEQAGKELDVDTRSDVYALGALLYEMLSDRTPLDATRIKGVSLVELQRLIQEERVLKPSAIADRALPRSISNELDWIALRALEKDRRRRYQSVADLGDDIERYLANQPVTACPPSIIYTARKFAKRNLVPLVAASTVLVALVVGTTVSVWQAIAATNAAKQAETQRLRAERNATEAQRLALLADKNLAAAVTSRRQEEQQRSRAEDNLLESFAVANLIDDQLKDRPGSESLRVELLTATLDHFDVLFADADLNQDHLRQLAKVYTRSALLRQLLGNRQRAIQDHQKSLQIYENLSRESPDDPDLLTAIAKTRIDIAYNYQSFNQSSKGIQLCEAEIPNLEALIERYPGHRGLNFQLSRAYNNVGVGYGKLGQHRKTEEYLHHALPIRIELAAGRPSSALAQLYNDIGYNQLNLRNFRAAIRANRQALEIRRALCEARPDSDLYRSNLAASHNHVGDVYRITDRYDEALNQYDHAIEIEQDLVARNEARSEYRSRLANSYDNKAKVLNAIGNHEQALELSQAALEIFQSLVEIHFHWNSDVAGIHNSIARILLDLDRSDEARPHIDQALDLLTSLRDRGTNNPLILSRILIDSYGVLVDLEIAQGNFDLAEAAAEHRWQEVGNQTQGLNRVILDYGKLATAVLESELDQQQAQIQHDRYVNQSFKVLQQLWQSTSNNFRSAQ